MSSLPPVTMFLTILTHTKLSSNLPLVSKLGFFPWKIYCCKYCLILDWVLHSYTRTVLCNLSRGGTCSDFSNYSFYGFRKSWLKVFFSNSNHFSRGQHEPRWKWIASDVPGSLHQRHSVTWPRHLRHQRLQDGEIQFCVSDKVART